MNYIQQNAINLCMGLEHMRWNKLEREMLDSSAPDWMQYTPPANLHRMRPSDAQLDRLFANDDTSHLPKQVRNQIQFITNFGEFNV